MRSNTKIQLILFVLFIYLINADNLPQSREANIVESTSPSEVMVKASGIGTGKKQGWFDKVTAKELTQNAEKDARKTAVWYILLGSTDPLIQNKEEREKFDSIKNDFFKVESIKEFLSWESNKFQDRIRLDDKKLKITKTFKVNKKLLNQELVERGIIQKRSTIIEKVGLPTIMVIPAKEEDEKSPIEILKNNSNYKHGANVIQSYLTSKEYEVVLPEQQKQMEEQISGQFSLKGTSEDYSYMMALSIGSDIYISYNISIESREVGTSTVKKAIVGCKAYETTTSRLLGTETGYSEERRMAPEKVLIEEAMHSAIDNVLSRVLSYWKNDLEQGLQYKTVLKVDQSFAPDRAQNILFSLRDIISDISQKNAENSFADYTFDVRMWMNPEQYKSPIDVYQKIKTEYKGQGELKNVSLNKKLVLLRIENN